MKEPSKYGITGNVTGCYNRNNKNDIAEIISLAMDAALQTPANIGVPAVLTSYVDTGVTSVLYAPRNATELAKEVQYGKWTDSTAIFKVREASGFIAPYGDFSPNGRSDVNYNFPRREQANFQTVIEYGDFEQDLSTEAKLNLIADKQMAAATTISIAANYFYLFGVAGREITGLFNDPNLNPAVAAAATGTSSSTKWADKTLLNIYDDIIDLFNELVSQNPNITQSTPMILALSPSSNVQLARSSEYNTSVMDLLSKYFIGGLKIVVLPELEAVNGDNTAYLICPEILGEEVAVTAFGEKFKLFPLVREMSGQKQKAAFSTYGGIIKHPDCVAQMTGI